MAGWFTASTTNTGVFYSSEENHEFDQEKLDENAGVQILVSVTKHISGGGFERWAAFPAEAPLCLQNSPYPDMRDSPKPPSSQTIHLLQQILGLVGKRVAIVIYKRTEIIEIYIHFNYCKAPKLLSSAYTLDVGKYHV